MGDDHVGNEAKFYIDGRWVDPVEPGDTISVVDPATEEEVARVAKASEADVEAAVQAARRAFDSSSLSSRDCLLYTSDAADTLPCGEHGGRRMINNKT